MITYFHRNIKVGYSIAKVSQTYIDEIAKTTAVESFFVPAHKADPISVLRNIWYVFKHRNKTGINHITGDIHYCAIALIGCKSVLTIHDLSAVYCAKNPLKRIFLKFLWYKIPLRIVDKVVCISSYTKENLTKIIKRSDIEVIHNAVDSIFKPEFKEFCKNKPIVLQIGTGWNKNLLNIAHSLSSFSCHLRIVGKLSIEQQEILSKVHIDYSAVSDLTDNEIIEEYKNCDIVCFCSIYEGFGMPIVEGNAIGRCIITSNLAPMDEIGGNAACFVDPANVDSIRDGFNKLAMSDDYRIELISNGFDNIKRFQSAYAAKSYLNLYNSIKKITNEID